MKILNWGILSTARINQALISPLRISKRNELIGIASRSMDRATIYAHENMIPRSYGTYEDLLSDPDIDVVYIPLPNHLHAEWAIKSAEAGKHILCEKPLGISTHEVDSMIDAARNNNVILTEAFMYRHHSQTKIVNALIKDGAIGDLQVIRGSFTFSLERVGDIRLNSEMGGGSIWDVGCYPISYAIMLAGSKVKEVFGWQVNSQTNVDIIFTGQIRFENGIIAQFDSGFKSPVRTNMEIIGRRGSIVVPRPFNPKHDEKIIINKGDRSNIIHIPGEPLYLGEIEDIASAVMEENDPLINLSDSRENIKTIAALIQSAEEGKLISVV